MRSTAKSQTLKEKTTEAEDAKEKTTEVEDATAKPTAQGSLPSIYNIEWN